MYIHTHTYNVYEGFTTLAETRLAQNSSHYLNIYTTIFTQLKSHNIEDQSINQITQIASIAVSHQSNHSKHL